MDCTRTRFSRGARTGEKVNIDFAIRHDGGNDVTSSSSSVLVTTSHAAYTVLLARRSNKTRVSVHRRSRLPGPRATPAACPLRTITPHRHRPGVPRIFTIKKKKNSISFRAPRRRYQVRRPVFCFLAAGTTRDDFH